MKLFQELNLSEREAYAYYYLGDVAFDQRMFEEAKAYFQEALDIFITFNDQYAQADTYHQLGVVAQASREYEKARNHYQRALDIFIEA